MTRYDILERLNRNGYQAYFAGGCVRDILLGREPSDYDIVTDALPDDVLRLFPGGVEVGRQFGVIIVGGFDVATLRRDSKTSDGRRPDAVTYTVSIREDSERRDFTINAMYSNHCLYDFHGGREDLENKVIRCVGDPIVRFTEDYLRMLRAVRFAAQLGFTIEDNTMEGIKTMADKIADVSAERVREELIKILLSDNAAKGLRTLDETGMLEHILPEVSALKGVQQRADYHPEGDVFTHTLMVVDRVPKTLGLRLAALLHDVGKAVEGNGHETYPVEDIMVRLRFDNETIDYVKFIVRNHMRAHRFFEMKKSKRRRLMADARFLDLATFETADDMVGRGVGTMMVVEHSSYEPEEIGPEPLLRGQDLIALGWTPGPVFKAVLDAVYDMQLEGTVGTKEAAVEAAKEVLGAPEKV